MNEAEIKKRWEEYFSSFFNAREPKGHEEGVGLNREPHTKCYYSRINHAKVRVALQKIRRNKAVGLDQIPIEAWKSLGDGGNFWLTSLFNKIFTSAKMPEEWRLSEVIPIFKNKDVGLHQGLEISPYLCDLIRDELSRGIQKDIPWCLIFANNIVLVSESAEGLNIRLENWRKVLEDNDLRVNREKIEYLRCDFSIREIAHIKEVDTRIRDKIL
nr:hypothetical protein [Tanacetum cinerariifolium]